MKRVVLIAAGALVTVWLGFMVFHQKKPLPAGISFEGPTRPASGIEFLHDLSYQLEGQPAVEQEIFDRVFSMIDEAEDFVVIDMFLFDGGHGGERDYRPLSGGADRTPPCAEGLEPCASRRSSSPTRSTTSTGHTPGPRSDGSRRQASRSSSLGWPGSETPIRCIRPGGECWPAGWVRQVQDGCPTSSAETGRKVTARAIPEAPQLQGEPSQTHRHGQGVPRRLRESPRCQQLPLEHRLRRRWFHLFRPAGCRAGRGGPFWWLG